jgi:hypothetical protein
VVPYVSATRASIRGGTTQQSTLHLAACTCSQHCAQCVCCRGRAAVQHSRYSVHDFWTARGPVHAEQGLSNSHGVRRHHNVHGCCMKALVLVHDARHESMMGFARHVEGGWGAVANKGRARQGNTGSRKCSWWLKRVCALSTRIGVDVDGYSVAVNE